ncbi:MAG: FAD-dependent oxidoreductase [Bacilli bacterium]|nr:FAD-dependent oxidoreductase [Bacilli bacterium]
MNEQKRIVVVGGVAGGMSFATRYKRLHPHAEVIVLDKGPYVSFANCGLPYALGDVISKRHRLIVETKERLGARFEIDVYTDTEVIGVYPDVKEVEVINNLEKRRIRYDELVLSPGAKPFMIDIPGLKPEDTYVLRNIPDLDRLQERVNDDGIHKAIVIGAGFIGLEVAENLKVKGFEVTIVEKAPHVLPPFDEEMAEFARLELVKNGVNVYANDEVIEVKNKVAILKSGHSIKFDLVVMSVGVVADTNFLKDTGIKMNGRGFIYVDDHYQTSVKDIYAVGDAILVKHEITGELVSIALANPANRQGRQLADHLGGFKTFNRGTLGTAILKLFTGSYASTGLNERQVKNANLPYKTVYLSWFDHATYYPGATGINLKVIFNPDNGLVYGAQGVGEKGVDKRIDIIATAIKAKLPINEWPELEFSYAPPFGMAKDIVNLAGYFASNVMQKVTELVEWHELEERMNNGAIVVDVRSERERMRHGYIKGSINIPIERFRDQYDELPLDREIILYCESGTRSYNAERILKSYGYKAYNLNGAYAIYQVAKPEHVIKDE